MTCFQLYWLFWGKFIEEYLRLNTPEVSPDQAQAEEAFWERWVEQSEPRRPMPTTAGMRRRRRTMARRLAAQL